MLASNLRLNSRELAAIGEFYDRFAHDLLNGKWPEPRNIYEQFLDIQEDLNGITDAMGGWYRRRCSLTICILANAELHDPFPRPPRWGSAQCGFIKPSRIAGLAAFNALKDRGIDIDILFFDPKWQKSVVYKTCTKILKKHAYYELVYWKKHIAFVPKRHQQKMLEKLKQLRLWPAISTFTKAKEWITTLEGPSGWFETEKEFKNYVEKRKIKNRASSEEVKAARTIF